MKIKRLLLSIFLLLWAVSALAIEASKNDKNEIRFLTLSDIHFDPFVVCYQSKGSCPLIDALDQVPSSQWAKVLAKYDVNPSKYREDTNYPLLSYTLNKAKIAATNDQVQFVLILGDFLGHDYRRYYKQYSSHYSRANYRAFVRKTLEFLNDELVNTFPGIDIYAVPGNNDSYIANYGFYPSSGFYNESGTLWAELIKNPNNRHAMRVQFAKAGYYSVDLSSKLRLLVLNTVLFSTKAKGKGVSEAASVEIDWLQQQLVSAKRDGKKVLIAMHIPPGIDIYASLKFRLFRMIELWNLPYIEQYEKLLGMYAPQIVAIFAGHLHYNLLQALSLGDGKSVPMVGAPSISPFYGNNPSFNVYVFSSDTYQLEKVDDFNYPISKSMSALNL